jgi:hypothetical protein
VATASQVDTRLSSLALVREPGDLQEIGTASYARSLADLKRLSDGDLERLHDALAVKSSGRVVVGVNYYVEELARRRQERTTAAVVRLTEVLVRLTWLIAALTAIAVILGVLTYLKG